ncbi:GNAT family N-acetyltransferase [Comamonas koreensis]|uniref:GNAT family N-acetyltransferase n=1 Tax=Comamonas koreensis TaxID=160825 RepID=A0AAW4XYT5_9BURK|nr:GNAT family N-acetyltransferase [Comamonas koreensis]MCD2166715.1 GNAT family N-acetyltransferase [Comamonas koreensis]
MLIRPAHLTDASALPAIEKSAAQLFGTADGLAWLRDAPVIGPSDHARRILNHAVWVAEAADGALAAFISTEIFDSELHIWELSVHAQWQRRGIASLLIDSAYRYAVNRGLGALTLTTFSDVPWCAPAYAKRGFAPLLQPGKRLQDTLDAEAMQGLPPERRIAMRLPVGGLIPRR